MADSTASAARQSPAGPLGTAASPAAAVPRDTAAVQRDPPADAPGGGGLPSAARGLTVRTGADGSFSLWSEAFREGFHSARGALREARETFLIPSQLERFPRGSQLTVLEVCVGTGCNLAVLLEACARRQLRLDWIGLELDPEPLRLALSEPTFRATWQTGTLQVLEQLLEQGGWSIEGPRGADAAQADGNDNGACGQGHGACDDTGGVSGSPSGVGQHRHSTHLPSRGRLLWGDARRTLAALWPEHAGRVDLIWHDAFSPQRCPELWTLEWLSRLTQLLRPDGRWISYCSAAAVREALRLNGLELAALRIPDTASTRRPSWSGGTLASPRALPASHLWRSLTPMEREHLACGAGEPYRDPTGTAAADAILTRRQQSQGRALVNGSRGSSSAWRRRWGVDAGSGTPTQAARATPP